VSATERLGCAALLAGLPGIGPGRLTAALDLWEPEEAWARATSGRFAPATRATAAVDGAGPVGEPTPEVVGAWRRRAGADPQAELERHQAAGVAILLRDDPAYPLALLEDLLPPPVLFVQGDLGVLSGPRVAVVGTRRCTGGGAAVARTLGRELAEAGVAVVSGLALGIDGAAHRGTLDGRAAEEGPHPRPPIGVIGSGHDRPYPAHNRALWHQVAATGLLLGEAPLGVRPAAWRFPARNRVIAALADLVVVVESHDAGGSLLTVRAAIDRGRDVMAVPGSVRNPAAAGTNALLADGCHPVRDVRDVLMALGLRTAGPGPRPVEARRDRRPAPGADGRAVLEAFDWEPATLEHLALRTGRPVPELALALHQLEADGWVAGPGPWYERVGQQR
jgi:DNA processing protein